MLSKPQFSDDLVPREPKLQLLDNLAPSGRNCNPKPKIYDLGAPTIIWGPRSRNCYPNRSSATIWGLGGRNYSFSTIWPQGRNCNPKT